MGLPKGEAESDCPILNKLPVKLREKLLPFQKDGIRFAVGKNGRCLIADEMGLGKTIQAISVAYYYKDEWPLLIIVPSSLKFCWIEELEKWLPDILPHQINLVQCGSDASGMATALINIVTYGLLRLPSSKVIREAVNARKFKIIICDESHYLKSIKTLCTKTVIPLLKSASRRILLSGTPALAKPVELYPQIDAICPGKFGSYTWYTDRYCDAHLVYYGRFTKRQVDGASNLEELQQKLKTMLMIRREKDEVLTQLPPKQRQRVLFELKQSTLKKEIYDQFSELKCRIHKGDQTIPKVLQSEESRLEDVSMEPSTSSSEKPSLTFNTGAGSGSTPSVHSQISRLYKLSGEAKIGPVKDYIEMLCDNEQLKFLVFAFHHDMMDGVQQTLWNKHVKFIRIDGTVKSSERQALVSQFQSDPEIRVAILSILAAGVGLTFTAAKLVVFAELYWTPGMMIQCEDRAHRIGQTSSLPVHYLVAKGTMDEWVWSAVCKKTIVTSTALSGKSKQLDHNEGDKYQIDLLSNANMWKPEENTEPVNIAELVQSQRPVDQSSILEFFPSQKTPDSEPAPERKPRVPEKSSLQEKEDVVAEPQLSPMPDKTLSGSNDKVKKQQREPAVSSLKNPSKTVRKHGKLKIKSEIILVSDDEDDDFRPISKKPKLENKTKQKSSKKKKANLSEETTNISSVIKPDTPSHQKSSSLSAFSNSLSSVPSVVNSLVNPQKSTCHLLSTVTSVDLPSCLPLNTKTTEKQTVKNHQNSSVSRTLDDNTSQSSHVDNNQNHVCTCDSTEILSLETEQWSCGACTFLNHPDMPRCEMCDSPNKKTSARKKRKVNYNKSEFEKFCICSCEASGKSERKAVDSTDFRSATLSKSQSKSKACKSLLASESVESDSATTDESEPKSRINSASTSSINSHSEIGDKDSVSYLENWHLQNTKHDNFSPTAESIQKVPSENMRLRIPSSSSLSNLGKRCNSPDLFEDSPEAEEIEYSLNTGDKLLSVCTSPVIESFDSDEDNVDNSSSITSSNQNRDPISHNQSSVQSCSKESTSDFPGSLTEYKTTNSVTELPSSHHEDTPMTSFSSIALTTVMTTTLSVNSNIATNNPHPNSNTDAAGITCQTSASDSVKDLLQISAVHSSQSCICSKTSASPIQSSVTITSSESSQISVQDTSSPVFMPLQVTTEHQPNGSKATECHKILKFSCSVHTGRIYVYDERDQSLQANFHPIDVEAGNVADLPDVLQVLHHQKLLQKFVREWSSLTDTKKRLIAKRGLVFASPLLAYEEVKSIQGNKQRHLNKQDNFASALKHAKEVQGSVRVIAKHSKTPVNLDHDLLTDHPSESLRGIAQTVTKDGVPVCLHCHKPYTNKLLSSKTINKPENAWQFRLCSYACMDKYWTLTRAGYCRDQIYEVERGVCRLCQYDAHAFYKQIKITNDAAARAKLINESPYHSLASKQRQKMVEQPQAGQFWHVDHITPVWQGGGMCDLDNLRTLCTPCHLKVTSRQAGQRAAMKKLSSASGKGDITAFFQKT